MVVTGSFNLFVERRSVFLKSELHLVTYELLWIETPYSVSVKNLIKKGIQSLGSDKHVNRFLEFNS